MKIVTLKLWFPFSRLQQAKDLDAKRPTVLISQAASESSTLPKQEQSRLFDRLFKSTQIALAWLNQSIRKVYFLGFGLLGGVQKHVLWNMYRARSARFKDGIRYSDRIEWSELGPFKA